MLIQAEGNTSNERNCSRVTQMDDESAVHFFLYEVVKNDFLEKLYLCHSCRLVEKTLTLSFSIYAVSQKIREVQKWQESLYQ